MSLPTRFSVSLVSELFFRHVKELSIRSLSEVREGSSNKRPELRLVRGFGNFSELRSTSRFLKT